MTKIIYSQIVGSHFRPPAKQVLAHLPAGAQLMLIPEPENPYDPNAIKVCCIPAMVIPEEQHQSLVAALFGTGVSLEEVLETPELHLGYLPAEGNKKRGEAASNTHVLLMMTFGPVDATLGFAPDGSPTVRIEQEG